MQLNTHTEKKGAAYNASDGWNVLKMIEVADKIHEYNVNKAR